MEKVVAQLPAEASERELVAGSTSYGITADTSFEKTLSLLLASTAVVT
jgi:hypothetical protein